MGESVKDLKIPYLFGVEDEPVIEKSILALIALLKRRFEPGSEQEIKDSLSSILNIKTSLIEKTYRTDYFLPDSVEKGIACEMLTTTPVIDSGILKVWLGPGGHGPVLRLHLDPPQCRPERHRHSGNRGILPWNGQSG